MAAGLGTNELNEAAVIQFDVLPDDVLLVIFDLYLDLDTDAFYESYDKKAVEAWQTLVHVCQQWRSLVFGSPRRLNLRLVCTSETHTKDPDTLDIWPALPLVVKGDMIISGAGNIIAVLGHSNRVTGVELTLGGPKVGEALAMMQVPFPELTKMWLTKDRQMLALPVIPDSFLGGSAPRLRSIYFNAISFPGLPKLLSSATHLVDLWLTNIPYSGYVSPEAMVASLSVLSGLEVLHLGFEYRPDWETRRPPPPTCSILPALKHFSFSGIPEYSEDFVSRIDTPQLEDLHIKFFNQIDFDLRRLTQFINRTPKHRILDTAHIRFDIRSANVLFGNFQITHICQEPVRQLSSVAQICNSSIPSVVENLYIERGVPLLLWENDVIENILWLQLLLPFTAVKNLYLDKEFAPSITTALQELLGERITEVLPKLRNIFVEGLESFEKNFAQFVVARQLSSHPVAISDWDKDSA